MATKLPKVDAVVVGVGWAGGIISAELTKAGLSVVGLERGKSRSIEDYLMGHDELRFVNRREMMQDLSKETITFRHNKSQSAVPMRSFGSFVMGDGLGGAGAHWNGQTLRFLPYDFEIRSQTIDRYGESKIPTDMPLQDWGISYEELQPYYEQFEEMAGISGQEDEGPYAPPRRQVFNGKSYPTGPMKVAPVMQMFIDSTEELGYHPFIWPSANLSEIYTNSDGITRAACQYCAFCEHFGCEYGAKADPVVTVIPVAQATGKFDLRTHSNVVKVLKEGDRATGVLYVNTLTGEEFIQEAEVVVLTSYVFNNVKLMLVSEIGTPYDPQTGTGSVGKNYCYQVTGGGTNVFFDDKEFNYYAGAGALGVEIGEFNGDNFDHSELDFLHGGGIRVAQYGRRPIAYNPVPPGTPRWGKEYKETSLKYVSRNFTVAAQGASLPNVNNFLDLDPRYKDAYGLPLVRITYNFYDQDRNLAKYMASKTAEIAEKMNPTHMSTGGDIGDYDIRNYQSTHNTGGTIMGADPATSTVNSYCQVWECENLFTVGANVFAHNSGYNPTNTVGALAYRAAEGILKYKEQGGILV